MRDLPRRLWARRRLLAICLLVAAVLPWLGLRALDLACPFPTRLLEPKHASVEVRDRTGKELMAFLDAQDRWYFPVPLDRISPAFQDAIISAEDKHFWSHSGVDLPAIARACVRNLGGHRRSGASTITMQTVRLLDPRPRTFRSKCVEAFRAWQLEKILPKDRILELYINRTGYGGNLVGIEAASRRYFGKHADQLSLTEAACLAGLPQAPSKYRPDRYPGKASIRADYVLQRMVEDGKAEASHAEAARREGLRVVPMGRQFMAPHFSLLARKREGEHPGSRTTLDLGIQEIAERSLRRHLEALRADGIDGGAVVVLENGPSAVRALVGSPDFFSAEAFGQVDGAMARRSPGSTLKPFTYALAFEEGIATPSTVLLDLPYLHPDYTPRNYDREYQGPLPARQALIQSLNVPAIRLLQDVGTDRLLSFLQKSGMRSLRESPDHYGLSLTLGGCEVSLLELSEAYSTLARLGVHKPLRFLEEERMEEGERILSPGAAYMVADILRDKAPLEGFGLHVPASSAPFAWKTGTSSQHRDAWAVLYNPRYTIAVWLGNPSGKRSPRLVGATAAMPVACGIFEELTRHGGEGWYAPPKGLGSRSVCSVSGELPIAGVCTRTVTDLCLLGKSSDRPCEVHVQVEVDAERGCVICPHCKEGVSSGKLVCERWPLVAQAWLKARGDKELMPPHNPDCGRAPAVQTVGILSPTNGATYALGEEGGEAEQFVTLKGTGSETSTLYWFEDGVFLKNSKPDESFKRHLSLGTHRIVCANGAGERAVAVVHVVPVQKAQCRP